MRIKPMTALVLAIAFTLGFIAGLRSGQAACYDLLANLDAQLERIVPLDDTPPRARPGGLEL